MTELFDKCERLVVRSSVIPSAKYSCFLSPLRSSNGGATIERRGAVTSMSLTTTPRTGDLRGSDHVRQPSQPVTMSASATATATAV